MKHDNLRLNLQDSVIEIHEYTTLECHPNCNHLWKEADEVFVERTKERPCFIYQTRTCVLCKQYEEIKNYYYQKIDYIENPLMFQKFLLEYQYQDKKDEANEKVFNIIKKWQQEVDENVTDIDSQD